MFIQAGKVVLLIFIGLAFMIVISLLSIKAVAETVCKLQTT